MRLQSIFLITLVASTTALPFPFSRKPDHAKPAYFLLAGDSTTATQNAAKTGGGWGDGFLNYTLKAPSSGQNFGHNGATTASFRAGGDWATVLAEVVDHTDEYQVYVTIQFGHNDQKSTSGVTLDQYFANLVNFTQEAKAAGATPILITSLTRRNFNESTTPPTIIEDLATQRALTIQAAQETKTRYIDLNKASVRYCDEIGEEASWEYNLTPTDHTHLNVHGSVVFGRMVSDLMAEKYADIRAVTQRNMTLTREIEEGIPAKR